MDILSNEDCFASIHWCPDGKVFEISSQDKLVADVLPLYFKSSNYSSFIRKLYRWGFQKSDNKAASFYSKRFLRDRRDKISEMCFHYSEKELRIKRAKKCMRRNSIIKMLDNDKRSSVLGLGRIGASTNLQSQSPPSNTQNMQTCSIVNQTISLTQPNREQIIPKLCVFPWQFPPVVPLMSISRHPYPFTSLTMPNPLANTTNMHFLGQYETRKNINRCNK